MASVFTEHVRHFGAASDPAAEVLPALERLLRSRMRRKNLLSAPPEALGYAGVASWAAPNAFEDIVADCYLFAVLQRLAALRVQLRVKPNIDGLVARNVGNFLLERQRRHDPIGYAVFGNVAGAALDAAVTRAIVLENLDRGKLHNETVLRLAAGNPAAAADTIRDAVRAATNWPEDLRALTATTEGGREWVSGFLSQLQGEGVVAVRCGDLVAALAARVRAEWAARHAAPAAELARDGDDEYGAVVRMVWPDDSVEARDRWERLRRLAPERIARLDRQERVRARLADVFAALVRAAEGGGATPTQAELIDQTGIARATLSDDFRTLRGILSALAAENPDA